MDDGVDDMMDLHAYKSFSDELIKISASHTMADRFEFEKIASARDVLEKMAEIDRAYKAGEISELEKEAGIAALRGIGGALMGGGRAAARMGQKIVPRMGQAFQGAARGAAAQGAGRIGQGMAGVRGAATAGKRGLAQQGGLSRIGQAMKGGYRGAVGQGVKAAPSGSLNAALGAGAVGAGAGLIGGSLMSNQNRRR